LGRSAEAREIVRIVQSPRHAQTVRQFLTKHIDTSAGVEQGPSECLGERRQSFDEKLGGRVFGVCVTPRNLFLRRRPMVLRCS
jgi:hypothetical protein